FIPNGVSYIKERVNEILNENYTSTFANRVKDKIVVRSYEDTKKFFDEEESPELIAVKNGILNINTKDKIPFTSEKKFFSKIPVTYDEEKDCPSIKKFMGDILENKSDINVIQELFGFCLFREYFEEKAFLFNGCGRNGKTKLITLLKLFLGIENCVEITLQSMESDMYAPSELHKKLSNIAGDMPSKQLEDSSMFKKTTGRDLISAPRKFKVRLHFVNYSKQIFSCNEIPITNDFTDAFFLRWIILNFPYQFLQKKEFDKLHLSNDKIKLQNPNIIEEIVSDDELSGLLNWALEGLKRLRENKEFSHSQTTEDTKMQWMRKSSSVEGFLMDECELKWGEYTTKEDFAKHYSKYCAEHKIKIFSSNQIKECLENKGVIDDKKYLGGVGAYGSYQQRVWNGIKMKDTDGKKEENNKGKEKGGDGKKVEDKTKKTETQQGL
ncbi:hypothetical protein GOV12_02260, partial [Candidatus Pacearchaeota archaeon]|nr:hypothetical protein [Candidatus Pacearchaeota archaeon]